MSIPIQAEPLERRTLFAVGVPVTVDVNTAQTFQTIEGFGAGMQSWSKLPEYSDPNFFDTIVNDLGTTMVRAPILPLAEKTNDDADPNHFNWAAFDSSSLAAPFDFLQQMKQRGVTEFLGSAWTAPAWMKSNNLHTDGGSLRPDMYAEYAEYLSAVTQIAKNDYGIDLSAISVQNEPYFVEPYESTTYTTNQLREAVRAIGRKFAHDGVTTQIVLPEDLIFEDRNKWYVSRVMDDPETKNYVGAFAGHGLTAHWDQIRDVLAPYGKEFWMTETSGTSGTTWEGAMGLANSVMNSIGTANASTYLYWQFSGVQADASRVLMINGVPTPKYYAAKQFYRWIRPGMLHVGTTSSLADQIRVASFKDPKTGAMTTVILNKDGDSHDVTFDLSGSGLPGTYQVYRSSSTEQAVSLGTITGGSNFTITAPGLSVITITNVPDPTPVHGGAIPSNVVFQGSANFTAGKQFFINSLKGYNDSLTIEINNGADVNQVLQGWTPLMLAAESPHPGSPNTFQNLLDHGANVNATNPEGMTPLHLAAANSFVKFGAPANMQADKITKLIALGANPNATDANGRTPLIWAGMMGAYVNFTQDPSIIKALLAGGADPFLKDNAGKTALDWANAGGYDRLADVLIAAMGLDHTKPTGDVVDVTPDPRDTSVTDFFFNFSERVQGFDITDITLTRNGVVIPWPADPAANGYILTDLDDTDRHYQLSGVGGLTAAPGNYVISISATGSGITDTSLNPLAADISDAWTDGDVPPPPTDQTPFKGSPFAVNQSGTTQIEFEDFDNGGEGVAYHDVDTKNLGGAYRTTEGVDIQPTTDAGGGFNVGYTKAGEWLEYTLDVADAGNYDFAFRVASTGSNAKFHAEIDGADVTGALTVPNTGGWQTYQQVTKTGVVLTAGPHVLRIALDAAGSNGSVANLNWIKISPTGIQPPPPPDQTPFSGLPFAVGNAPTTIQLEDFDNGGEGIAYHDTDSINSGNAYRTTGVDIQPTTDTGGGFNIGYTKAGEWLEYTINVAQAGTYDFAFRLASTGSNAKFHAEIDASNVTGALTVPNTGGYQSWQSLTRSGVNLTAGQHILRVAMDAASSNGSVGNFNWLQISPPPSTPQQTPFTGLPFAVGTTPATLQTEDFDNGGEGVAYHDTDTINNGGSSYRASTAPGVDVELTGDAGGGNDVGFTKSGEWLEYTINVAQAGTYSFDFRVASKGLGGKFNALLDGVDKTGQLQVPDTLAWNTFATVTKTAVSLPAGQHVLRLAFDTVGAATGFTGNFNWIKITQTSATPGGTTTIANSTAAYVRGGTFAAQNFGADPTLVVKKHSDPSSTREAFLTFDLTGVSTINSAKLRLFGSLNDTSSASVQSQIFAGATTAWDETTLTWNNSRAIATGSALASATVTGTTQQWYEFDVTAFLKSEKALGHNTVTLVLKNPTQQNALVVFNSDDAASNRPELAIT